MHSDIHRRCSVYSINILVTLSLVWSLLFFSLYIIDNIRTHTKPKHQLIEIALAYSSPLKMGIYNNVTTRLTDGIINSFQLFNPFSQADKSL